MLVNPTPRAAPCPDVWREQAYVEKLRKTMDDVEGELWLAGDSQREKMERLTAEERLVSKEVSLLPSNAALATSTQISIVPQCRVLRTWHRPSSLRSLTPTPQKREYQPLPHKTRACASLRDKRCLTNAWLSRSSRRWRGISTNA